MIKVGGQLNWRLAAICVGSLEEAVAVIDDRVFRLECRADALFVDWTAADAIVDRAMQKGESLSLNEVEFAPPWRPGAVFCAGANYRDHVIEMLGRPPAPKRDSEPFFFMKPGPQSVVGHGASVALPHASVRLDWEAEIAVVIARRARHIRETDAMNFVAGYTIVNDLSARDLTKRIDVPFTYDWIGQKCFPGSLPMGPWITPASRVENPHSLAICLSVNGVLMQDSNSEQMHWSIQEQVAYLSRRVGLNPGDLIATGTPAGCGIKRNVFLKEGDVVRVEIEGLGTLVNRITAIEANI